MNPLGFAAGILVGAAVERLAMRRVRNASSKQSRRLEHGGPFTHYELATFDGGLMHAYEIGSGPPIVLLHGVTLNAEIWGEQLDLADAFRVIAVDLRAHGDSVAGLEGSSISANTQDLIQLLEELDLWDATVVGHSMGGMVLGHLLTNFPEVTEARIGAIGFISSAGRCPARVPKWLVSPLAQRVAMVAVWRPGLARQLTRVPGSDLGELAVRATFGSAPTSEALATVVEAYNSFPVDQLLSITPSLLDHNVLEGLAKTDLPTGVIVGSEDPMTPPSESHRLVDAMPHATLEILEGAGHQLMLERPDEVNQFLENLASRR